MDKHLLAMFLLACTISASQLHAQSDSSIIGLRLNAKTFFDNKEFTGNIKKGYTIPGINLQPSIDYEAGDFSLNAGLHVSYLAGADTVNQIVPVLGITYSFSPCFNVLVGTLPSSTRCLPEAIYKPERVYMDLPGIGIELNYSKPKFCADVWMNWERFIRKGSPFQEEFMVGMVYRYRGNGFADNNGLYLNLYEVVTHAGGQIDATELPVTTISNTGLTFGYGMPVLKESTFCAELSGFGSIDGSPTPHLTYKNGSAIHANFVLLCRDARVEAGFWRANRFINPRGEELYGSLSTIDSTFNIEHRNMITAGFGYTHKSKRGFEFGFKAGMYLDVDNMRNNVSSGTYEYYYTLILKFNNRLLAWKE